MYIYMLIYTHMRSLKSFSFSLSHLMFWRRVSSLVYFTLLYLLYFTFFYVLMYLLFPYFTLHHFQSATCVIWQCLFYHFFSLFRTTIFLISHLFVQYPNQIWILHNSFLSYPNLSLTLTGTFFSYHNPNRYLTVRFG